MPRGLSLIELTVVLGLVAILALVGLTSATELVADARAAAGARALATTLQALRWRAVAANRSVGLYFARDARGWYWYVVRDGNGNGLRTAEVRDATDPTLSGPYRLEELAHGVYLGFPPVGRVPAIPPRRGSISDLSDPVQFGRSNLIAFSPMGTASSGTLYLTDRHHRLRALVLFGPSSRLRVWRFDIRRATWKL